VLILLLAAILLLNPFHTLPLNASTTHEAPDLGWWQISDWWMGNQIF